MNLFDQVKQEIDFKDVEQTREDRSDKVYCGICNDNDAALTVYEEGNWKCYSCGAKGGDVISYVAQRDGIGQGQAAKKLIQKHGLDVEIEDMSEEKKQERKKLRRVRNCQEDVVQKAEDNLSTAKRKQLQEKRGWSKETINELRVGWMDEQLFNEVKERYEDLLEDAGIHYGMTGNKEGAYVFPHLKKNGQPYLLTCRDPKPGKEHEKYQQSKSTEWVENDIFYATGNNSDTLVVTEGYPDAISAYESGVDAVAAGCGSFKGNRDRILNFSESYDRVLIVLDNDETGREELQKIGKKMIEHGNALVYRWPEDLEKGYDLDDWTTDNGFDLEPLIEEAENFLDIMIEEAEEAETMKKPEKRKNVFKAVNHWKESKKEALIEKWTGEFSVTKKQLRQIKAEVEEEITEQTEQTEQTEKVSEDNTVERGDTSNKEHLKNLASQSKTEKKRLQGKVNGEYFFTAWLSEDGLERPALITRNDVSHIKNKLKEKRNSLPDDKELTEQQKEKYDYWYAEVNGEEVQFQHEIPKTSKQAIYNLDNRIIKYVIDKEDLRSKEEIFDDAKDLLQNYWSHYHDEWFDISIAYNFHTFLLPALGYTVYIMLKGRPATGKTTWQKVNSKLEYNGCFAGNLSPPTAVRYAHSYFATLHQDEMEKQSEGRKNQMQGLYNTGQRKNGVYNITNMDAGTNVADQIQEIQSFCGKSMSVNNLYNFEDSFVSRNVILKTVKTKEKGLSDPDSMSKEEIERFKDLQAEMAYYVLENWKEILESIEEVRADISDTARDEDKMALFKGIVKHFKGSERADAIEERIRDTQRLQDITKVGERTTLIFERVAEELKREGSKLVRLRLSDIKDSVNQGLDISPEDDYKTTSKSVKRKLKEYDVVRRKEQEIDNDSEGYAAVEIYLDEFLDACDRYDLTAIYQDLVTSEGDVPSQDKDSEISAQSAQFAQSAQYSDGMPKNRLGKRVWKSLNDDGKEVGKQFIVNQIVNDPDMDYEEYQVLDYLEKTEWVETDSENNTVRKAAQEAEVTADSA